MGAGGDSVAVPVAVAGGAAVSVGAAVPVDGGCAGGVSAGCSAEERAAMKVEPTTNPIEKMGRMRMASSMIAPSSPPGKNRGDD